MTESITPNPNYLLRFRKGYIFSPISSIIAWTAILCNHTITIHFLGRTLKWTTFLHTLHDNITPFIYNVGARNKRQFHLDITIQQDDNIPPRYFRETWKYLDATYPDYWKGCWGSTECLACSPDLTQLDPFCIKSQVLTTVLNSLDDLRKRIFDVYAVLNPKTLHNVREGGPLIDSYKEISSNTLYNEI